MPTDLTKSELAIMLGDAEYIWRLDWKAIRQLENAATQLEGQRVVWSQFLARNGDWDIDDYGLVLWAGLHRKDPSITYDFVMEHAQVDTFHQFFLAFNDIITSSIPDRFKKKSVALAETASENPSENSPVSAKSAPELVSASA